MPFVSHGFAVCMVCFLLMTWSPPSGADGPPQSHNARITKPDGTVRGNVLYYNRVSKAGSTTMLALAHKLASRNGFHYLSAPMRAYHQPDEADMKLMQSLALPVFYANHHEIINPGSPVWRNYKGGVPIFINILREPVSRYRSAYDYSFDTVNRSPRMVNRQIAKREAKEARCNCWDSSKGQPLPFNDCVLLAVENCPSNLELFQLGGQATFKFLLNLEESKYFYSHKRNIKKFCSPHHQSFAYTRAKHHIDHHYTFVGISEEMGRSVRHLERILPQFYSGASKMYEKYFEHSSRRVTSHASDGPTTRVHRLLESNPCNLAEVRIYNYVKKLFYKKVNGAPAGEEFTQLL